MRTEEEQANSQKEHHQKNIVTQSKKNIRDTAMNTQKNINKLEKTIQKSIKK